MRALSAETRSRDLSEMADRSLDVLVVGGGATGAGVALDAASRGFQVGLVEREDFAAGTSGRSSRLIHGGLRYLRHGEVGIVRESLRERAVLMRLAPHLVRRLPLLVPARRRLLRLAVAAGLTASDLLAAGHRIGGHRRVGDEEGRRIAPGLARSAAGYVMYDGRTDDARLTLEVVRRAAANGALIANHAEVVALGGEGRVRAATVADAISGEALEIRARVFVNATGAWADRVQGLAADRTPRLRPSKGVHLVFDRERIPLHGGLFVPSVADRFGFVFAIPWGPRVYAGTTDTPYEGDLAEPGVDPDDEAIVLASLERALRTGLERADILSSWAGVRPLLDTDRGSTRDLSRRHIVYEDPPGLVTVTGGKLTTYRAMAEEVTDLVARRLGGGPASRTATLPLGLTEPLAAALARSAAAARDLGAPAALGHRLVALYGDDWPDALALAREDPSLADPLVPGLPVRRLEVRIAREREMALTDDDLLVRRTRLAAMDADAGARALAALPG